MKHKKLFAILTLVCFMFTLMPVAAMAEGENVAEFNGTQYPTLKAAIEAANVSESGGTIKVLKNCTLGEKVTVTKPISITADTAVTITANDNTLANQDVIIVNDGSLTLGNNLTIETITTILGVTSGSAVIDGAIINNSSTHATVYATGNDSSIVINSGSIGATGTALYALSGADITVNAGTISSGANFAGIGAAGSGSVIELKGGDITQASVAATDNAVKAFNGGKIIIAGSNVETNTPGLAAIVGTDTGIVEITSGNVTGGFAATSADNIVITGGTFTKDPSGYVNAETHAVIDNGDGTYDVKVIVPVETVTVTPATVEVTVNEEKQLTATVAPNTVTNAAVTWESSDTSIATVDENGKVKGIAAGTATITATSVADTSKTATCAVTVKAATSVNPGTSAPVGGVYIPSGSTSSTPKVETETTVTPNGTKVETTTETTKDGTVIETVTTTTASGETTTTVTSTLDNGSAVTNNDAAVEVEVDEVSYATLNKAEEAVKADETVDVVGDKDNAISVSASNAATGAAQTDFAQPMSISVPVDNAVLNNVEDTSNLTLAKVVTNADGTTELVYMGGSYDEETGTFNAKVDEAGDYILVEKDDLVKIELTIGDTTVKHNDAHHELDVAPAINAEAGRTELPLRYLGEALGFGIDWNNNVVTITKDGVSFSLTIGVEIPGYGTPYIDSDRTMVSARYISEMLGANVIWDPVDRQVIVVK